MFSDRLKTIFNSISHPVYKHLYAQKVATKYV